MWATTDVGSGFRPGPEPDDHSRAGGVLVLVDHDRSPPGHMGGCTGASGRQAPGSGRSSQELISLPGDREGRHLPPASRHPPAATRQPPPASGKPDGPFRGATTRGEQEL